MFPLMGLHDGLGEAMTQTEWPVVRIGNRQPENASGRLGSSPNVLVQDSTNLNLPDKLVDLFPGSKNQNGKKKAAIRL
jgi:hypothetical protein